MGVTSGKFRWWEVVVTGRGFPGAWPAAPPSVACAPPPREVVSLKLCPIDVRKEKLVKTAALMPFLRDQRGGPGGGGGGTDKRRSVADFRGLEALLAEPSAPTNTLPIGFEGGGCWENATSPEPARSPRALVPPGCFPPRHPPSYASFSESARPGTGWSEETGTSGQSVTDLVTSLKSLALPPALPPAPQQNNRTSMHFTLSYEGVDSKMDSLWPPEANNNSSLASDRNVPPGPSAHPADTRAVSLARRASFCGVVRPDTNGTTAARWKGSLPERCADINSSFSPKVFFGGLPYDVTEQALLQTLKHFQPLRVEWPGPESSPRGFAYVTFENERRVRSLLGACRRGGTNGGTGWYYPMHCRKVQVIPWSSSDSVWARRAAARLEPQRTVFVGALHGMLTAADLAQIMDDLFGGVLYAGIDTDKNKYPIGSGRVTFDNVRSYVRAVSARHVEIITDKFSKKVQVDPYLEDSMCSRCQLQQGPYFCREPECYRYYCRSCWGWQHAREAHRPLMRNARAAPPPQRHCAHTDDYSSPPMSTLGAEGGDEEWSAALGPPPPARLGPAQQHEPPNAAQ